MDIEWSALTNLTLKDQHMATKKKAPAKKAPAKKSTGG